MIRTLILSLVLFLSPSLASSQQITYVPDFKEITISHESLDKIRSVLNEEGFQNVTFDVDFTLDHPVLVIKARPNFEKESNN